MPHTFIMQKASEELKDNKDFIIRAVSRPGLVTKTEDIENSLYDSYTNITYPIVGPYNPIYSDRFITIETVQFELEFVPEKFKQDKDVVLAAVKADKRAIRLVPESLKNDPDIKAAANPIDWPAIFIAIMLALAIIFLFLMIIISWQFLFADIACIAVASGIITTDFMGFFAKKVPEIPEFSITDTTELKPNI